MVDENFDPRSAESMKKFGDYAENANAKMDQLKKQMVEFNKSMAMSGVKVQDFSNSLRNLSKETPFEGFSESIEEVRGGLEATKTKNNNSTSRGEQRRPPTSSQPTQNITIQTLKVDVSGVTDQTDKRKLAKEISKMVSKELRSKVGGGMSNTGFNRGA
jgi:hypothetical protein